MKEVIDLMVSPLLYFESDLSKAKNQLNNNPDSQYARRVYVRTLFAGIEGTIYALKQISLLRGENLLSPKEVAKLKDLRYVEGEISDKPSFLSPGDNFKFTEKIINRLFPNLKLDIEIGQKSWDAFINMIEVRNRIAHPKGRESFKVYDDEIQLADQVQDWYVKKTNQVLAFFLETEILER